MTKMQTVELSSSHADLVEGPSSRVEDTEGTGRSLRSEWKMRQGRQILARGPKESVSIFT